MLCNKKHSQEVKEKERKIIEVEVKHIAVAAAIVGSLFIVMGILLSLASKSVTNFLTDEMNFASWDI